METGSIRAIFYYFCLRVSALVGEKTDFHEETDIYTIFTCSDEIIRRGQHKK